MLVAPYAFQEKGQPAIRRCVVGGAPLELKNRYDTRQHWLDFMVGAVFEPLDPVELTEGQRRAMEATVRKKTEQAWARLAKPYMVIDDHYRTMHLHLDRDQGVLPFDGHWKLPNKAFALLARDKFPGFERTESGKICLIYFKNNERRQLLDWCKLNATGYYNVAKDQATFAKLLDAVAAKLVFGVGAPR